MSISPACSAAERLAALGRLVAAGGQRDAQAGGLGERADALEMLAGEDFGRRHQRRLPSRFDDVGHRQQRDDRLARADVALQQPDHALRLGEIGADVLDRLRLRAGQREGQRVENALRQTAGADLGAAGDRAHARADHQQRELVGEQLVIGEPRRRRPGGVDVGRRRAAHASPAALRRRPAP